MAGGGAQDRSLRLALESLRGAWGHAASARFRGGLTAALGGALALALASWRAGRSQPRRVRRPARPATCWAAPAPTSPTSPCSRWAWPPGWSPALLLALGIARAAEPTPHATRATLRWRALAGVAGVLLLAGALAGASRRRRSGRWPPAWAAWSATARPRPWRRSTG